VRQFDVIVVGKGNAALCAALSAGERGARVAMLEAASMDESGGNSRFAGGVMRFAYDSVADLRLLTEITDEEAKSTDWESNTKDQFYDDLYHVTSYRTDPDLSEALITKSLEAMVWLRSQGARFVPNYRHQSAIVAGTRKFFGRIPLLASGGGTGPGAILLQLPGRRRAGLRRGVRHDRRDRGRRCRARGVNAHVLKRDVVRRDR